MFHYLLCFQSLRLTLTLLLTPLFHRIIFARINFQVGPFLRTAIDSRKLVHVKNPRLINSRKLISVKNRFLKIFIQIQLILLSTKFAISMTVNSIFNKFISLFKKTIKYCYFLSLTTFFCLFLDCHYSSSQELVKDLAYFLKTPIFRNNF